MSTDHPLSRRQFAATGLAGIGIALTAGGASEGRASGEIARPPDKAEALGLLARLHADLSGRVTFGWFEGKMLAIAPGGVAEPIGRIRGIIAQRLRSLGGGPGWEVERQEIYDVHSLPQSEDGAGFVNPITGKVFTPAPTALQTSSWSLDGAAVATLAWSVQAGQVVVETPFRVTEHTPTGAMRESLTLQFESRNAVENGSGAAIASVGTLLRMGPSPAWLGMEGNPGHMLYQCRFVGGLASLAAAPVALRRTLDISGSLASLRFGQETELG